MMLGCNDGGAKNINNINLLTLTMHDFSMKNIAN